jgi:hypothetical protein
MAAEQRSFSPDSTSTTTWFTPATAESRHPESELTFWPLESHPNCRNQTSDIGRRLELNAAVSSLPPASRSHTTVRRFSPSRLCIHEWSPAAYNSHQTGLDFNLQNRLHLVGMGCQRMLSQSGAARTLLAPRLDRAERESLGAEQSEGISRSGGLPNGPLTPFLILMTGRIAAE